MSSAYIVTKEKAVILDSNIPENEEGIAVFSGNHSLNQEVQKDGYIYRSLKDNNSDVPLEGQDSLSYRFLRRTNRHRCFDEKNNTVTSNPNEIKYAVDSFFVDTIAFFGLKAQKVIVKLVSRDRTSLEVNDEIYYLADGDVYFMGNSLIDYQEVDTLTRDVYDYYSYITAPVEYQKTLILKIKPYYEANLEITIVNENSIAEVGNIVYGRKYDFGLTLAEPKPTRQLSNLFETDIDLETQRIRQVPKVPIREMEVTVMTPTKYIDRTDNRLEGLLNQALLFVAFEGNDNLPTFAIYGFFKRVSTPIGLTQTLRKLTIKGTP